jgi:hypothetical protein
MAASQLVAEKWLEKNQQEMFYCPHQPGKLMISKNACAKRHLQAGKEEFQDLMKGDLFNYTYKRGLALCRECPIGKSLALSPAARESHPRRHPRGTFVNHGWKTHLQRAF